MDVVASVVNLATSVGLEVGEPVRLRSTNNLVMWLRPSAVVAKISSVPDASSRELTIAQALADEGAPVVPPAGGIGHRIYRIEQGDVSFWQYVPQERVIEPSSESIARAMADLHRVLAHLGADAVTRTYEEHISESLRALGRPDFAPELRGDDRDLLGRALSGGVVTLSKTADVDRIVHGSPHRMNILVVAGSPRFIDFETVQRGPLEWDLAHLEPGVADHYQGEVDADVLAQCRTLVSATTSTWCWDGLARGPDMRAHAEHHLAAVRSAIG